MKEIKLTKGMVAFVDDEDFKSISCFKWHALKKDHRYYANRTAHKDGKKKNIYMHHEIFGNPPKGLMHDHKDGNGLNNQKNNLRIVSNRQNQQNRQFKYTSKFPGVCWETGHKAWRVSACINGKPTFLGRFKNEYEAFLKYKKTITSMGEKLIPEMDIF